MRTNSLPVALATDFNPGSSFTESMPVILSLACLRMKLTPAEAITAATINAAHAVNRAGEVGSLEVGKKADIIILDLNRPHLQPVYNFASHLVYSATGADVRDVIIDGQLVMENRKLLTLDEEKILYEARQWSRRIKDSAFLPP